MTNRIRSLIEARGLSQSEVARALGVSKQSVSSWCAGSIIPRRNVAEKLADVLGVNVATLMFGAESCSIDDPQSDDSILIPCLSVQASCGFGDSVAETIRLVRVLRVTREWLRIHAPFANAHKLNAITADGDSMRPTINHGDLVVVDTSQTEARSDAVFAMRINDELFIKRIQRVPGGLQIISDNTAYPPYVITGTDLEGLTIIGRVCTILNVRAP